MGVTYHGLIKAECLMCGYETENTETLEHWNDWETAVCPQCRAEKGVSRWWTDEADAAPRYVLIDFTGRIHWLKPEVPQ